MMNNNTLKVNFKLETLSAVAVAVNVWELPVVKRRVYRLLVENKTRNNFSKDWNKVTEFTINQIYLCLPEKLLKEIRDLIQILGSKLYSWLNHVLNYIKCDLLHAKKIYWTCNGSIDDFKIVKDWLESGNMLLKNYNGCFLKKPIFCLASRYCQLEFVYDHVLEMKKEIFKHVDPVKAIFSKLSLSDNFRVMAIWLLFCYSKSEPVALTNFVRCNFQNNDFACMLFGIAVSSGFKYAVQYFFKKINENSKKEMINQVASRCLTLCENSCGGYEKDNYLEILIFLIKNMDDGKKLQFVTENFVPLCSEFLYMWPYQGLCLNLLNDVFDLPADCYSKIMKKMVKDLRDGYYKTRDFAKGVTYVQIFKTLLDKIPKEIKVQIFTESRWENLRYLKIVNCDVLNLIINDFDLQDKRNEMINIVDLHIKNLILEGGRYRDVDKLMKSCAFENKEKYNFLNTFLTTCKFALAEEHLSWLSDSEREKYAMKKNIDIISISTILIKGNKCDSLNEYLNWQCDYEEEKDEIKNILISNGVLRDQIYQVWCTLKNGKSDFSILTVKSKCEKLLKWFFESEEDRIEFRKTKLIDDNDPSFLFIIKYWDNLFRYDSFAGLDKFLEYCFWSPEKVDDLKEKISNNVDWWIENYVAEKPEFLMVDSLFTYAFKTYEEKRMRITEYMESPKGALLLIKSFKKGNQKTTGAALFERWIRFHPVCFSKIKLNLDAFNNGIICEYIITAIKSLLHEPESVYFGNNAVLDKLSTCNCLDYPV